MALSLNCIAHNEESSSLVAAASVLLSGYLLVLVHKNKGLLIVFGYLFLSVYSFSAVNYFGMDSFTIYQQWVGTEISFVSINVVLVFLLCITVLMPLSIGDYPTSALIQADNRGNGLLVAICVVALFFCGVFGIGSSYAGLDRQHISPIYEYSIVFLIVGLYFSGGQKWSILALALVTVVRITIDFSIGARVTSIEMISIWYIMVFASRLKARTLIPILLIAFVAMLTVGELRGSDFHLSALTSGIGDFLSKGFAWDGAYAAYHTSESMAAYRELTVDGVDLAGFASFLFSLVVGDSAGYVELQYEMTPLFWNMGGGYAPFFFYYYLGFGGVVVFSLLIGFLLRFLARFSANGSISDMERFSFIWISATCFRWVSYSISPLVRGFLLVALAFVLFGLFANIKPVLLARKGVRCGRENSMD